MLGGNSNVIRDGPRSTGAAQPLAASAPRWRRAAAARTTSVPTAFSFCFCVCTPFAFAWSLEFYAAQFSCIPKINKILFIVFDVVYYRIAKLFELKHCALNIPSC